MTGKPTDLERRNLPVLTGQAVMSQMAWTMGSPSVVLPFLAVSLELPMFVAGALVSVRQAGNLLSDIFLSDPIAARPQKKRAIAVTEMAIGICLLMAVVVAASGGPLVTAAAFVMAFLVIGLVEETQSLMFTDLLGDQLRSKSRMWLHYLQLGLGGVGAIALTLVVHELTKGNPPFARHSAVVAIAVTCFVLSAVSILAVREFAADPKPQAKRKRRSPVRSLKDFAADSRKMFGEEWFRKYMVMRMPLVVVSLAVPFFALIAAESHHSSARGLTALIISSASGFLVAAPLWQVLNMKSHRAVMVTGALMVAVTGTVLVAFHFLGLDHEIHLHAISLFVVTVAVTGVSGARKLYYMDVAPKAERVKAAAVIKSLSRLSAVILAAGLAAIAHTQEVAWAIVFVVLCALLGAYASFKIVKPLPHAEDKALS